ncbi:MAG: M48 family metalloprotease [Labilithrix sp.]|nr:M48 family metalloprotease [Labilithrix sp.]
MDRDEVALLLALLVCGPVLWLAGALVPPSRGDEQAAWRRLWIPAVCASVPFAVLSGWAAADMEGPQELDVTRLVASTPFALVWIRAGVRAVRAWSLPRSGPAHVSGLLRPRITVSKELRDVLEPAELRAVLAHEEAHARHRDPLRIWLAQILTELQWPFSGARERLRCWMRALELARDEEATREANADPADLASAILKAARLSPSSGAATAALSDDEAFLEARVRRLLAPAREATPRRPAVLAPIAACLVVAAFVVGVCWAHPFVAHLAGHP